MQVRKTSTLSLEKTELLDNLRKLEESDLEKAEKLTRLEEKYRTLEKFKNMEKRLVEKVSTVIRRLTEDITLCSPINCITSKRLEKIKEKSELDDI
ncbi:hypothetical protein TNCT_668831 [Trichonephila clavata]|uniref:Uncharacterized protein n=1 Tax=Trichonephila clavata TaxID=2740835 RepID=A0A8X6GKF9_TRICU|nr:hypothetical protein TNCT_668831 [Trichonephila clavata]